jgi:probable HAF family extracellular repeat protein
MAAWRRVVRSVAVLGLALAGAGCLPPGSAYQLVRLPTAGGEAERSFAVAINDRGQVLGNAEQGWILWTDGEPTTLVQSFANALLNERGDVVVGQQLSQSTIWRDGAPTTITTPTPTLPIALDDDGRVLLGPPFGTSGEPFYIWHDGQLDELDGLETLGAVVILADMEDGAVVGEVRDSLFSWPTYAFVWQDGQVTDLGSLGGGRTVARAINERGQVAGESDVPSGTRHAFLWEDGNMTDVGSLPGSDFSSFQGLSDAGHVVGTSVTATGESHAYRWHRGVIVDLGTLGGDFSSAADVNDRGEVVGWSTVSRTGNDPSHAFVWRRGRIQDLGGLGGTNAFPADINNRGEVAGDAYTPDGVSHAVLWTRRARGH